MAADLELAQLYAIADIFLHICHAAFFCPAVDEGFVVVVVQIAQAVFFAFAQDVAASGAGLGDWGAGFAAKRGILNVLAGEHALRFNGLIAARLVGTCVVNAGEIAVVVDADARFFAVVGKIFGAGGRAIPFNQIIGIAQIELAIGRQGSEQGLGDFFFVAIAVKPVGRRMPFAPCADKATLPHGDYIGIAVDNGFELLNMAFHLGKIGVFARGFVVVSKAQHGFHACLAHELKAFVERVQIALRQILVTPCR